jgi:hypothetical protein
VTFDGPDALMGRLVPVRVVAAGDERAAGELVGAGEGRHVA